MSFQSPEASPPQAKMLAAYLLRHLAFKKKAFEHRECNEFFNTSMAELQQLAHKVTFQLDKSQRPVTYQKCLLKHKVASFQLIVDQHKEFMATADTLVAGKQSVELALDKNKEYL
jgi:hypothetical protein